MSTRAMSDLTQSPEAPPERVRRSPLAWLLLALIRAYQWTSAARAPRCRFHPTCSTYARDSIAVHGALRGTGHALVRISKCHPWHPGGFDPVKPARK